MREATLEDKTVTTGPDVPDVARCPACDGEVLKRKRGGSGGRVTWFWRHALFSDGCPLQYRPVR